MELKRGRIMKPILILLALALSAYAEENPYEAITKRNAFNLTDKEPVPPLPPAEKILTPNVFLTGITRMNGVRKIHFVLRKTGDPDKFVSLATNEKQYNIELKEILKYSAYISNNGETMLLSFEKNGLPTTVTKAPPKLMSRRESSSSRSRSSKDK